MAIKSNESQRDAAGQRQNRGQHHEPGQWLDDFFHDDSWGFERDQGFLIAESLSKTRAMPGDPLFIRVVRKEGKNDHEVNGLNNP